MPVVEFQPSSPQKNNLVSIQQLRDAKEKPLSLLIWNQAYYFNLWNEISTSARQKGAAGPNQIAYQGVHEAITRDAIAIFQEKIPNEKRPDDTPIFDGETAARLLLTPTENKYIPTTNDQTGETVMVCPEHRSIGKSVTKTLTNWRRSLDLNTVTMVEELVAQDKTQKETKPKMLIWFSGIAQKWEDPQVRKFNGEYAYVYALRLATNAQTGKREAIVHGIKTDLSMLSHSKFLENLRGKYYQATQTTYKDKNFIGPVESLEGVLKNETQKRPLLDKLMSTVVELNHNLTDEQIYRKIGAAKQKIEGNSNLFGLPLETILKLQSPNLRDRVEKGISKEMADFLIQEMKSGKTADQIQPLVKDKFIELAVKLSEQLKKEEERKAEVRNTQEYRVDPDSINPDRPYKDSVDPRVLAQFRAPSGGFCGDWGSNATLATLLSSNSFSALSAGGRMVGSSAAVESNQLCRICNISPAVKGGCGYCKGCEHKAA